MLTSTTLMANVAAFGPAAELARQLTAEQRLPRFSVGCHVVLVDGEPLLPPAQLSSLVGRDGRFRRTLSEFAKAALGNQIRSEEIEQEATAQIRKLQAAGVEVSHFDTHKHVHMFPSVLKGVLLAAKNCGVTTVRNPFEANFAMAASVIARPSLWMRYAQVQVLRRWRAGFIKTVREFGMATTDGSLGVTFTGAMNAELLTTTLRTMPEGSWELVSHPGYNDTELQHAGTRLLKSRATELELLTSPKTRDLLQRENIELISFRDLR